MFAFSEKDRILMRLKHIRSAAPESLYVYQVNLAFYSQTEARMFGLMF